MRTFSGIFDSLGITRTLKVNHTEPGMGHTLLEKEIRARPAAPAWLFPDFVPGLPHCHVYPSQVETGLISYQDYHMLLLTLAGRGRVRAHGGH